jgi:hypothetical protein
MFDLRLAPLRLLWATLPLTLGPLLEDGLDPRAAAMRNTMAVGCWVIWGLVLLATLVPRAETLTVVRVTVPAALPAALWAAAAAADPSPAALAVGITASVAAAVAALVAPAGEAFVDGSSYGDERRMPLRPPGALLLGPIELAWTVAVAGLTAGPLLLAAQQWVAGAVVTVAGVPLGVLSIRALHRLARRWLVFVPAGFVVHDHMALADPMLFPRSLVATVSIAANGTDATDLTVGAFGIAVEARLTEATAVVPARRDGSLEPLEITAFLVAPSRPGAALVEAGRRRLSVGG